MTLYVLIVEDDEDFVEELREMLARLPGTSNIRVMLGPEFPVSKISHIFQSVGFQIWRRRGPSNTGLMTTAAVPVLSVLSTNYMDIQP